MSELAFDMRLAQAGLVVDPQTARIPFALGGSTYAIEAHETADGCLLRCDVESPGTSMAKYADALNQIGHGEPGETEVVVAPNRLTVVRHLNDTTSDDLRSAALRIAGMMQMAEEIVAMLRTADAAEERLAKAPGGKFPDLQPALNALGTMSTADGTTVDPLQGTAQVSPDGKWWWDGKQWVVMPPMQATAQVSPDGKWWWDGKQWVVMPPAPGAKKKGMGLGKRLLLLLGVAAAVVIALIIILPRLAPPNNLAQPLGPGPYYMHYDCGQNSNCTSGMINEGTANGGNTGIGGDYKTLAECKGVASIESGIVKSDWCSKSKNPADTHA